MDNKETWEKICEIHLSTKNILLKGEECEIDFKTFLQPYKEITCSHEHIMRYQASKLDLHEDDNEYSQKNLERAVGHEIRAFYDAADYCGIILRDKIQKNLIKYDVETIKTVLPEYYAEMKPKILDISKKIAEVRENKDIGDNKELIPQIEKYSGIIDNLIDYYKIIIKKTPSLDEVHNKNKKNKIKWIIITAIIGIILGIILNNTFAYFNKIFNDTKHNTTDIHKTNDKIVPDK